MKELIPMNVLERLEREWRIIDPERPSGSQREMPRFDTPPARRLRVGRVDGTINMGEESA